MAEEAYQRDERGGDQPQPTAGGLQAQPQCRAADRDAEPEQVIDEAPQELAVVQKGCGQQRPQPPAAIGDAIEGGRAADDQRKDHDQEQLAGDIERHQPGKQRHDQIAGQIRQRRPMYPVERVPAGGQDPVPRQMVRVIEQRRHDRREDRDAEQREQRHASDQHPNSRPAGRDRTQLSDCPRRRRGQIRLQHRVRVCSMKPACGVHLARSDRGETA